MLAKPEIAQLLAGINRSTLAIERVSKVMENLPKLIREERLFISSELDKRESALSKLLAEVRQTVNDTEHLVLSVDKFSGSGNVLLQELRVTSNSLNTTFNTFDNMMTNHFSVSPEGQQSKEESQPFDINEYTKAFMEVDNAAIDLTKLVGASGEMVGSERLTHRIEQLNNAAQERVEHATEQSEKLMRTLFLYIVSTIVFIFLLIIIYHKLKTMHVSKA